MLSNADRAAGHPCRLKEASNPEEAVADVLPNWEARAIARIRYRTPSIKAAMKRGMTPLY